MQIDIATIFPEVFFGPFSESIVKRAIEKGLIKINILNIRDFADDRRGTVDDRPYGGGPGMLMKPEPFFKAVESLEDWKGGPVLLMSSQGELFSQKMAEELAGEKRLTILCGHYEGVDERVAIGLADRVVSVGDYVLTNGNLAAMIVVDALARLIPGVLGSPLSNQDESHTGDVLLEHPQYTRPESFRGMEVPEILLSGDHAEIAEWRRTMSLQLTKERRPDLYFRYLKDNLNLEHGDPEPCEFRRPIKKENKNKKETDK